MINRRLPFLAYYESFLSERKPSKNFPDKSGLYKIISMKDKSDNYFTRMMILQSDANHVDIYKLFINEWESNFNSVLDLSGRKLSSFDDVYLEKNPINDSFELKGAGFCEVDSYLKIAKFLGKSGGFSLGIDKKIIFDIRKLLPLWEISF